MESGSLQQQQYVDTSEVTWTRLLEILNASSQGAQRSNSGNPPDVALSETAPDFPSSPQLHSNSPFQTASITQRPVQNLNGLLTTPTASSQHQQVPNPNSQNQLPDINLHQQQRQPQLQSFTTTEPNTSHSRGLFLFGQLTRRAQAAAAAAASQVHAAAGTDVSNPEPGSVSESAERHRLTSEVSGVSVQAFVEWLADIVPFLLLLAWVFIFKHAGDLMLIFFLTACIGNGNADIRKLIALRRKARVSTCIMQAIIVASFTCAAVFVTLPNPSVLRVLTMRTILTASAVDTLLLVFLADSILRFGSLTAKLLVVAWFRSRAATGLGAVASLGGGGARGNNGGHVSGARLQRQQSRVLTAVERAVMLYRTVLPGPVWYGYFLHGGGFSPVLASLFCGSYLVLKASYVATQTWLFALALKSATRRGALYGNYVGRADSIEEGTFAACPVCQDCVSTPVRLDCGHIFCEECILEWLERDRTCPMCRAQVRPPGLPSCSDGASPLLPQLF